MVPSSFLFLDALPRTASGKVDRRALPEPGAARPALESEFLEPRDEHEESAAGVFAQVLGLDRVGVEDDFFELGGDSLSAVEALARLSEKLGAELSAADLLEASTPAALAARVRRSGEARPDSLVRLQAGDRRPVFIVPGGGGDGEDLFAARRLARLTGGGFPFLCFRSGPGPHPPVEQLAARCVAQLRAVAPNGPYTLVGDCVGGILAFAMARRLREAGEDVALLALIDTPYPAPGRRLYASLLLRAPWADRVYRRLVYFRGRLRYHRGVLRALPRGRMAYALRMARVGAGGFAPTVSAAAHEARDRRSSYVGTLLAWRPARFDGTVRLVESAEGESRGFAAAWSRLASASKVVRVAGDHASLILEHGDAVAAALREWLDSEPSAPSGSTARDRSSARRGLARLSAAPRRALRRLLGRPPSDWMGPDGAPRAVRRAPRAEADNLHEVVSFEADGADVHADELDGFLTKLAETGHRVFRIPLGMRGAGPAYELIERAPRLFDVLFRGPEIEAAGEGLDEGAAGHLFEALDSLRRDLGLGATVSVVREPGWLPLVERMRGERAWAVVSPSDWAPLPVAGQEKRFAAFSQMLARAFPRISIVVVTYNNRDVNRVCLESLFARTEWPNTEVLVVDNASSDGTRELLVEAAGKHPNLRVIGLEKNRGFPAAANAGLARATGAYLIVLNNDTVLTRGWATTLLRHLAEDPELGLVGPVTNAIANAARVEVGYDDIVDLPDWAAEWTRAHDGETFPISMVAFFCVAMRREVFESVGPLDERFGLGLFEDKDYNRRVRANGWEIRCARDAFVHHWQMASFRRLGQEAYFRVFEENRKRYEDKWSAPDQAATRAARTTSREEVPRP